MEQMDLAAVILVGGKGTRLRAVVADRPKPLAPVAGRPFLAYLLDQIADAGIRRVVLSTGYMAKQFESIIGPNYRGLELVYAHEEQPLGTGGAIRFAGTMAEAHQLLIMNGDSFCDADLGAYVAWHVAGRNDVSLLLAGVDDASRYGTVEFNADRQITAFQEKRPIPAPGYINAGVYLFRREMVAEIPAGPSSIERDVFPAWLGKFTVRGRLTDGAFIDIGVPSDYERCQAFMARVKR